MLAAKAADRLGRPEAEVLEALQARERLGSTALGRGVALPHARLDGDSPPVVLFARLRRPVEFDAREEKPADLLILVLWPEASPEGFLPMLAETCGSLREPQTLRRLGVYAVLRVWLLLFGEEAGASAGFGGAVLLVGGLLTIAFGSVAVLAAQNLPRLAGASVLVSSGTLLAAVGAGSQAVTGGALFYLASSVLNLGALFLLIELVERGRDVGADVLAVTREAFRTGEKKDDVREPEPAGIAIPAIVAILGFAFMACALLLAGLPPLSGFLAKFAMMAPLLGPTGAPVPVASWVLIAALVLSGLATLVAMVRTGIDVFWASPPAAVPRVSLLELAPVGLLLAVCVGLTVAAGPAMDYMSSAAAALHAPGPYLDGVLGPAAFWREGRP